MFQIPPGHYLIGGDKHMQVNQYWDFHYPRADTAVPQRSDAEWAEEFRFALEEAVRVRLRADVPVGCYLSGGLDSCSVLGLAARHHPEPIRAFTLSFDRAEYDEAEIAREMATKVGADFHPIPLHQSDLADHFRRCNRASGNALQQCARRSEVPIKPRRRAMRATRSC